MVECQYCGQDFGNAGAKTTHEHSCDERPDAGESSAGDSEPAEAAPAEPAQPAQQGGQPQQPQSPSQSPQPGQSNGPPQQARQGAGQVPQPRRGVGGGAGDIQTEEQAEAADQIGVGVGEILSKLDANDAETRANALSMAGRITGTMVQHLTESKAKEMLRERQRAKEHGGQTAQPSADDVVECGACGGHIKQVPEGAFSCPHCATVLEL
jgi:hypothetical protein